MAFAGYLFQMRVHRVHPGPLVIPLQNHVLYQGCQNGPVTGAITGYFKVFSACKLLEKSEKNGRLKSCKIEKEKEIVLIMPCMFFFVKHLPYLGNTYPYSYMCSLTLETHIPSDMCSPTQEHVSLLICVPLPGKQTSLVKCVPITRKHISLVICVPLPRNAFS